MIDNLKKFYKKGVTLDYDYRILALDKLEKSILYYYDELIEAFKKDLNKCEFDVINTEIGLVLKEIKYFKNNLHKLMQPKKVRTNVLNWPSKGCILNEPYGVVFIASPWNYPFLLSFSPLAGAIAAGNVVCLKVSDQTPSIKEVIKKILSIFSDDYIYLVGNSKEERERLFDLEYDYVFYTGSSNIAQELMKKQAKYLTPMTLELGGKSPCIVDEDADIESSARRIAWGKYLNSGQTCVAPDYILVHASIKDQFVEKIIEYTKNNYYKDDVLTDEFMKIINDNHLTRLTNFLKKENVIFGGKIIDGCLEPTIVDNVDWESKLMKEEIFGPIMPIITYHNLDEIIDKINEKNKPLALYCFSKNKAKSKKIIEKISFGGGCVNDVIMHVSEMNLPFGGVQASGMGSYHGKASYKTFTHEKSVLLKHYKRELMIKYSPYNKNKTKFTKMYFDIKK